MSDTFSNIYVGDLATSLDYDDKLEAYDGVEITVDENTYYYAGHLALVFNYTGGAETVYGRYDVPENPHGWHLEADGYHWGHDVSAGVHSYDSVANQYLIKKSDGRLARVKTAKNILFVTCPYGTETMAWNIYNDLNGPNGSYQFQPYNADGAVITPAAEIGDGINVGRVYGGIYENNVDYTNLCISDVSAGYDEEVDHEYPYVTQADREFIRNNSKISSELKVMNDEISARVTSVDNELKQRMDSELTVVNTEISAKVSKVGSNSSNSFSWSLTDCGFILSSGGRTVFNCNESGITVNGNGSFTGDITSSNATITGGSLSVGSNFSVDSFGNLTASNATITGKITSSNATITGGTLSVGSNFSVDSFGNLTANNATITGTLTVGGTQITAANLALGASQAASNYSTWNGTSTTVSSGAGTWNSTSTTVSGGSGSWWTGYNYAYGNDDSYKNSST